MPVGHRAASERPGTPSNRRATPVCSGMPGRHATPERPGTPGNRCATPVCSGATCRRQAACKRSAPVGGLRHSAAGRDIGVDCRLAPRRPDMASLPATGSRPATASRSAAPPGRRPLLP